MGLYCSQIGIEWGGYGVSKRAVTLFLGSIRSRDQSVVMTYSSLDELCVETPNAVQVEEICRAKASGVRSGWVISLSLLAQDPCSMEREVLPQSAS